MQFPYLRMRRLRRSPTLRDLVRETQLTPNDLILPYFVVEGENVAEEISALPGVFHLSLDRFAQDLEKAVAEGVRSVILFGLPGHKDPQGSQAWHPEAPVQKAVALAKKQHPELLVITDVCLCQYTDHGHCGLLEGHQVANDPTLDLLAQTALSHAQAGADMVAPSDMMDGRVEAIRQRLDAEGFQDTAIMAYSAKFASSFYGPFREAAHSTPSFGDRRAYQMDPANRREAIREAMLDAEEGADILMVKPALPYLDILREIRDTLPHPLAAYNVSGEYSMVKAAAEKGWIDERAVVLEMLTGMKRAGADLILTYHTRDVLGWL
ncbi:MAG: porphobilinogen synthase [Candidatus Eremiobacteraeota bacterium]|nr:porphobilinogen synthase [Candidatus Eremiobacteraeota bacterium]